MVAGGFRNDLIALGDCIEHDDRYDRIVEYVSIMKSLLEEPRPLTFCPYLVGSYDEVRCEVSKYIKEGFRTFILDVPPSREELHHTAMVF